MNIIVSTFLVRSHEFFDGVKVFRMSIDANSIHNAQMTHMGKQCKHRAELRTARLDSIEFIQRWRDVWFNTTKYEHDMWLPLRLHKSVLYVHMDDDSFQKSVCSELR